MIYIYILEITFYIYIHIYIYLHHSFEMEQLQIFLVVFPEDARALMSTHLAFTKWKECCFSTDQLKTTRWLLGARPKNAGQAMAEYLTVTPLSQTMLMELHIKLFNESARKVKPSARNRIRASCEDFEKLVDYACMFAALRNAAKLARCDSKVDGQLVEAFLSKLLGFFGSHYITSSQTRIVEIYIVDIQQTIKYFSFFSLLYLRQISPYNFPICFFWHMYLYS